MMDRVAYSYLRFSSPQQALGDSQRRQVQAGAALAAELGCAMAPDGFYADRGVSGFKGKHAAVGELSRFLGKVESGAVKAGSVLIIENLDRLSREEMGDALGRFLDLLRAGVTIATVTPRRVYTKSSIAEIGSLIEAISIMQRGWEESNTKSVRVGAAWENKRRRAREDKRPVGGAIPGWLALEDGKYVLRPDRARTVRQIFAWALEGQGASAIATMLRADPERFPPWGPSGTWSPTYVWQVLRSPTVYGAYQGKRVTPGRARQPDAPPSSGHYPAVLSLKDWTAAQAALKKRRVARGARGAVESNLFTRLLTNAVSGQPMGCVAFSRGGQRFPSIRDTRFRGERTDGFGTRFPYPVLERALLRHVAGLDVAALLGADQGGAGQADQLREQEARLAALDARAGAIQAELEDPSQPPAVVPALAAALRNVLAERGRVAERVGALRAEMDHCPADVLSGARDAVRALAECTGPDLARARLRAKERLRELLSGIFVVIQRWHKRAKICHVQCHYRAGGWTTLAVVSGKLPAGAEVLDLQGMDLRQGYPPRAGSASRTA